MLSSLYILLSLLGYPLTALPTKSKEALLKVVVQCPPLTQEKAFRYFFELLLSELSAGACSYGSRIMLLLLVQCNSSVCVETSNMVSHVTIGGVVSQHILYVLR